MILTSMAALFVFFILTFSGFGFYLLMKPAAINNNLCTGLVLAPVLGVSVFSIIGTYLILLNLPVHQWIWPVTSAIMVVNGLLIFSYREKLKMFYRELDRSEFKVFVVGFALTAIMLFLPMIIGGSYFFMMRGNAYDQFNYITLAHFLWYQPYDSAKLLSMQSLINIHSSFALIPTLIKTRWSTSMLLAWLSSLGAQPIYQFIYSFDLLFYLMLYGVIYGLCRLLAITPKLSVFVALVTCIGFWAQFVIDIEALSEINGITIVAGIAYAVLIASPQKLEWRNMLIIALMGACLVLLYAEMTLTLMFGMGLFYLFSIVKNKSYFKPLIFFGVIAITSLLMLAPVLTNYLLSFMMGQLHGALSSHNDWWPDFFSWLYNWYSVGFWGMSTILFEYHALKKIVIWGLIFVVSGALSFIFVYGITSIFSRKIKLLSDAYLMIAALALSGVTQFALLYFRHEWWAAGKGLSYAYPYYILLIAAVGFGDFPNLHAFLKKTAYISVFLWLMIQLRVGYERIYVAIHPDKFYMYPNYIGSVAAYKSFDLNFSAIQKFVRAEHIHQIAMDVRDPWMNEYLVFVLGDQAKVINLRGILQGHTSGDLLFQTINSVPNYLIVDKNNPKFISVPALSENADFKLILTPQQITSTIVQRRWSAVVAVKDPYSLNDWGTHQQFWVTTPPSVITFFSQIPRNLMFTGRVDFQHCDMRSVPALIANFENTKQKLALKPDNRFVLIIPATGGSESFTLALTNLDQPKACKAQISDFKVVDQ